MAKNGREKEREEESWEEGRKEEREERKGLHLHTSKEEGKDIDI